MDETGGFQCLGHSNWTICSPLSTFSTCNFPFISLSYWEANSPIRVNAEEGRHHLLSSPVSVRQLCDSFRLCPLLQFKRCCISHFTPTSNASYASVRSSGSRSNRKMQMRLLKKGNIFWQLARGSAGGSPFNFYVQNFLTTYCDATWHRNVWNRSAPMPQPHTTGMTAMQYGQKCNE